MTDYTLYSYAERRDYVRTLAKMTRTEFDALPEAERAAILARLRFVVDRNDTRSFRDSMGCLVSGASAAHTSTARSLVRIFTEKVQPVADNSTLGRITRYAAATTWDQARNAIYGATKVQLVALVRAVGISYSSSWKNAKFERVLTERFPVGVNVDPIGPLAAPGDRVTAPVDGGPEVWAGTVTGWVGDPEDCRVWVKWDHDGSSTDMHRAWLTVVDPAEVDADDTAYVSPWSAV